MAKLTAIIYAITFCASINCYDGEQPRLYKDYILRPSAGTLNTYGKTMYMTISIQLPQNNFDKLIPPDMYCPNEQLRNTNTSICIDYNASLNTFRDTIEFYENANRKTMPDISFILDKHTPKRREKGFYR